VLVARTHHALGVQGVKSHTKQGLTVVKIIFKKTIPTFLAVI